MSGQFGWKLLEMLPDRVAMVIAVAPAAPGNIQPKPILLRETADQIEVQRYGATATMAISRERPFAPSKSFVDHKLIGTGNQFPWDRAEVYRASLKPTPSRLVLERSNVGDSALKINDIGAIRGKPIVLLHGTHDPDHSQAAEQSTCDWFNAHGAQADRYGLGEHGIPGNGHMLMLEQNSAAIADVIVELVSRVGAPGSSTSTVPVRSTTWPPSFARPPSISVSCTSRTTASIRP
jgi:pimeloyl-ACP methyl ester carboxylesterase